MDDHNESRQFCHSHPAQKEFRFRRPSGPTTEIDHPLREMEIAKLPALVEITHPRLRRLRRLIHPLQPPLDPGPEIDQGHQLRPPACLQPQRLAALPQPESDAQRLGFGQAFEDAL